MYEQSKPEALSHDELLQWPALNQVCKLWRTLYYSTRLRRRKFLLLPSRNEDDLEAQLAFGKMLKEAGQEVLGIKIREYLNFAPGLPDFYEESDGKFNGTLTPASMPRWAALCSLSVPVAAVDDYLLGYWELGPLVDWLSVFFVVRLECLTRALNAPSTEQLWLAGPTRILFSPESLFKNLKVLFVSSLYHATALQKFICPALEELTFDWWPPEDVFYAGARVYVTGKAVLYEMKVSARYMNESTKCCTFAEWQYDEIQVGARYLIFVERKPVYFTTRPRDIMRFEVNARLAVEYRHPKPIREPRLKWEDPRPTHKGEFV